MNHLLNGKTILITGGTGFLGSSLIKRLINDNVHLIILKRSQSDLKRLQDVADRVRFFNLDEIKLDKIFRDCHPDIVIHCATDYGRHFDTVNLVETNLILPLQLLQQCVNKKQTLFINTDTILDKRVNAYALSKSQFLDWLKFHAPLLPCINIALEHFYGPFDNASKFCSNIVLDFINGVGSIDLTQGDQKRDFIYIDDVVDAFITLIDYGLTLTNGLHQFEVGTGHNIKIRDFVLLVQKLVGNTITKLNFGALPYRSNEVMEYPIHLDPLLKQGWKPRFNLEQGLKKTINAEKTLKERS